MQIALQRDLMNNDMPRRYASTCSSFSQHGRRRRRRRRHGCADNPHTQQQLILLLARTIFSASRRPSSVVACCEFEIQICEYVVHKALNASISVRRASIHHHTTGRARVELLILNAVYSSRRVPSSALLRWFRRRVHVVAVARCIVARGISRP